MSSAFDKYIDDCYNCELQPDKRNHVKAPQLNLLIDKYEGRKKIKLLDILGFYARFDKIHPFEDYINHVGRLLMKKNAFVITLSRLSLMINTEEVITRTLNLGKQIRLF